MTSAEKEVDELIDRHRQRLRDHRKFLDGDNAKEYESPGFKIEQREALAPVPTAERNAGDEACMDTTNAAPSTIRERSAEPIMTFGASSSNTTFGLFSQLPCDRGELERSHPPDDTRYFTNSPTRMYERSMAWVMNRERKKAFIRAEMDDDEFGECTFHPQTQSAAFESGFQHHHYRNADEGGTIIDAGEANFIERQRLARQRKAEAELRLCPDTSKWVPRTTVPKEFNLGRKGGTSIPALKKPFLARPAERKPKQIQAYKAPPYGAAVHSREMPRDDRLQRKDDEISELKSMLAQTQRELLVARSALRDFFN